MTTVERLAGYLHIGVKLDELHTDGQQHQVASISCKSEVPRRGELTAQLMATLEYVVTMHRMVLDVHVPGAHNIFHSVMLLTCCALWHR
jgi:hypothetical protein